MVRESALSGGVWKIATLALVVAAWLAALAPAGLAIADQAKATFAVRGLGGAGGLFNPSVSPYDPNFMMVACDMGGTYRSEDGGKTWELIHFLQMGSNAGSAYPAYLPDRIVWNQGLSLRISRDLGKTWAQVPQAPWKGSIRYLGAMEASGGKPEVLFVSAVNGLFRSEDGGQIWSQLTPGFTREIIPLGDTLYTIFEPKAIAVSKDRGKTWEKTELVVDGAPIADGILSLTGGMDSSGLSVLIASVWKLGLVRSVDGGKTWKLVEPFTEQNNLMMARNQTKVVWAAQNHGQGWCKNVWVSTNGGDSWKKTFLMGGMGGNVAPSWVQTELKWGYYITKNGFYASQSKPEQAILATQGDIYTTQTTGESWYQRMNEIVGVKPGDTATRYRSTGLEVTSCWGYYFDPWDQNREYIAFTDIGFGRSVDRGETWSWSASGSPWLNTFYEVAFDPDVKGRMYAAASNRHDIPYWTNVNPVKPGNKVDTGGVVVSTTSGTRWSRLGSGLPDLPCTSIEIDPTSPPDRRVLWAGLFGGGVFKSVDGGQTWLDKSKGLGLNGNLHVYRVRRHPKSGELFCLVTARREDNDFKVPGGVFKSVDGGETWTDITASISLYWPTNLTLDPDDPKVMYVTAATPPRKPQGGVYRTTDGGASWKRILDDKDLGSVVSPDYDHVMAVAVSPSDKRVIYVGTSQHGLWYSTDAGQTWSLYEDYPARTAQSINFSPRDKDRIYVTSFGAGVWVGPSLPGGAGR